MCGQCFISRGRVRTTEDTHRRNVRLGLKLVGDTSLPSAPPRLPLLVLEQRQEVGGGEGGEMGGYAPFYSR